MTATEFIACLDSRGCKPVRNGHGWHSRCPAHEDSKASLSVGEGNDGRVLVKCHRGCSFDAIVSTLGLKKTDLFPDKPLALPASKAPTLGRIVATYPYRDESDALLFEVVRFYPKDFRQRRPDPNGKDRWSWNVHGVRRVLFRLPETVAAIQAARTIWIVEGEKDALALVEHGLDATCNSGGAGKWLAEHAEALRGARVAVISDRDEPGRNHAQAVAASLHGKTVSLRVIEVRDVNGKRCKDPADYFDAGGLVGDLVALVEATREWTPPQAADPLPGNEETGFVGLPLASTCAMGSSLPDGSDAQRAERFVSRFHEVLRFVPEWERWLVFEGRWKSRDDGGLIRLSCQLAGEILGAASKMTGDAKQVQDAVRRAHSEANTFANNNRVASMSIFARADKRVIIRPEDVDSDPWVIGAPNCIIDLRTGAAIPHSPDRLVTRFLGCDYDPAATAPRWEAFLNRVLPASEVRQYVQKAAGYSLTGVTTEHHFMFLYGTGANGKSTFLETVFAAFGDYAGRAAESLLYSSDRGATPPDVIAEIAGVRFLAGSETQEGARLNEGSIKDVTGGDTLRGARKYEHGFKFRPAAKLWIAGNHRPAIRGSDEGIWRRVRLIDFPVQIPAAERDTDLANKLLAELPGIVNWLLAGCISWRREGLKPPVSVQAAVAGYRLDEDVLGDFLMERTEQFGPASISHADLYRAYRTWSDADGTRHPLSNRSLSSKLRDRGWLEGRGSGGGRIWRGVKLRDEHGQ